jgi:hypothetical protein
MFTGIEKWAADWAEVALANIRREYPNDLRHTMTGPDDRPRPRDVHPAFYGSYDWHSCVEMHWLLVRLLRVAPESVPAARVQAALDEHLTAEALATEAAYFADHRHWSRPYGWAWALLLAHEVTSWDDPRAAPWAAAIRPLADVLTRRFIEWLPSAAYPIRHGVHSNTAFGLAQALPYARAAQPALASAICATARRWYGADTRYPAEYEPSGADFLSPALIEAELMRRVLPAAEFGPWLAGFLPDLASGRPATLFTPVGVPDPTDGYLAHLHGLNLSRAWCWRNLAAALPADDPRRGPIEAAVARHADASLAQAAGSDYMVEHWLAAYATLLLTG